MRKLTAAIASVVLASWVAGPAFSADNASVDVVMTIQSLSVSSIGNASLAISAVAGASKVTDRAIFKNDGNGTENFAVKITSTTGSWTPVTGTPGANQYRLSAVWHEWNVVPGASEFGTNDALTGSNQTSSDTVFFNDSETHATSGTKGYNVAVNGEQSLFFKFDAPASGTGSSTAHVTVTALATP